MPSAVWATYVARVGDEKAAVVLALCAEIFPDEEVPARARLVLEDVFTA